MVELFSATYESLIVLILTALSCSLLGCLLLLRGLAMIADALSHAILLGIVLAFFLVNDLSSPWLIVGAGLFGLFTVYAIENLSKSKLVKNDEAIGLVYPMFFALAVILITVFARNIHLDMDAVLMGEVIMAPLNRFNILGISLPKAMVYNAILLVLNLLFLLVCFKELKLTSFDPEYAKIAGFSSTLLYYGLMTLTSLTTVISFDAVGAILVISFLITPAASAYLISKDLKRMMEISCMYALGNCLSGYVISILYNVSTSGMTAWISGISFMLTVLFHQQGIFTKVMKRYRAKRQHKEHILLLHIANHIGKADEATELGLTSVQHHLHWSKSTFDKTTQSLINQDNIYLDTNKDCYRLTSKGELRLAALKENDGL